MAKIKLIPVKTYNVEVGGKVIGRFDVVSEWNGMAEIANEEKQTIICSINSQQQFSIGELLKGGDNQEIAEVVKASPSLIDKLFPDHDKGGAV